MTMTSAEKQRAFRSRQKARMLVDPEYAAEIKARRAEQNRRYYERADKDKLNRQSNERYKKRMADPEYRQRRVNESMKYYWANRESVLPKKKAWREANKESIAEYMAKWELQNRDIRYALTAKRNYQIASGSVEPINRNLVWERDAGICGICGDSVEGKWHMDHIIPLSLGGSHTYDNVQVSHPRCNIQKSNKILTGGEFHRNQMLPEHTGPMFTGHKARFMLQAAFERYP